MTKRYYMLGLGAMDAAAISGTAAHLPARARRSHPGLRRLLLLAGLSVGATAGALIFAQAASAADGNPASGVLPTADGLSATRVVEVPGKAARTRLGGVVRTVRTAAPRPPRAVAAYRPERVGTRPAQGRTDKAGRRHEARPARVRVLDNSARPAERTPRPGTLSAVSRHLPTTPLVAGATDAAATLLRALPLPKVDLPRLPSGPLLSGGPVLPTVPAAVGGLIGAGITTPVTVTATSPSAAATVSPALRDTAGPDGRDAPSPVDPARSTQAQTHPARGSDDGRRTSTGDAPLRLPTPGSPRAPGPPSTTLSGDGGGHGDHARPTATARPAAAAGTRPAGRTATVPRSAPIAPDTRPG